MRPHRTRVELADGRELLYFDSVATDHDQKDRRALPARPPAGELRYDVARGEWVTVAAARQSRPFLPPTDECPLCPSQGESLTEIPSPAYEVAVFENRFPSFGGPVTADHDHPAQGRCEVVCFTDAHDTSFSQLSPERVELVMAALADRTRELSRLPDVAQVFCFENRGEEIGVTLHHPHGQIYGYPYITPTTEQMLNRAAARPDLFAGILAAERADERVVASNDLWTAFVPVAARWPFEVHIYPHRQFPDLAALPEEFQAAFAPLYLDVLRRLDALFDSPLPYVSGWHQAPVDRGRDLAWLHLELYSVRRAPGKLKYLAGSESAMGAFINDVQPELAARLIREAVPTS
ncbi:UDPglucose--hexose-1-phosphate uridylyltransferase [Stackebrandtia endophytica]|uniref:Galactose-1-phosphate uridylyltransferase n=1 Tax=Stackebrandtia endophytica TaxID=1496996 RepID=A0A543AZJ9_9ACTN|nr:galactose-1-phosphate uridylyltransferase [Stackebrandtia endophytica]TQL77986.1 UDPglucose--hexose-1-phosphate uridylyltransferase [Stackebrandtia endophytica]